MDELMLAHYHPPMIKLPHILIAILSTPIPGFQYQFDLKSLPLNPHPVHRLLLNGHVDNRIHPEYIEVEYQTHSNRPFCKTLFYSIPKYSIERVPVKSKDGDISAVVTVDKIDPGYCNWIMNNIHIIFSVDKIKSHRAIETLGKTDLSYMDRSGRSNLDYIFDKKTEIESTCQLLNYVLDCASPLSKDFRWIPILIKDQTRVINFNYAYQPNPPTMTPKP